MGSAGTAGREGDPDIGRAKVVVPEGPDAIVTSFSVGRAKIVPTADRLYVEYQLGGPSELRVFDLDGRAAYLEKLGPERVASLRPGPAHVCTAHTPPTCSCRSTRSMR